MVDFLNIFWTGFGNGEAWIPLSNLDLCRQLSLEADFYELRRLIELLQAAIKSKSPPTTFMCKVDSNRVTFYNDVPTELSVMGADG
jgi:hypothetical protein